MLFYRETSTTQESPPTLRTKSVKSKNIFKRLSGSRSEKVTDNSGEFQTEDSLPRSVSSPTLLDSDFRSSTVSSVVSSASCDTTSLQSLLSTDSLLSLESHMSHEMSELTPAANVSPDSGKGSMLGEASYCSTIPSQFNGAQDDSNIHAPEEGVWITCKADPLGNKIANKNPTVKPSNGLTLLCENYTTASEEEDSSHSHGLPASHHHHHLNTFTLRANVLRKKSVSAEDLQLACVTSKPPVRAQSMCALTGKKFIFKPRLEISKQTHNLLARAGYIQAIETDSNDVPVPTKSPRRSSYREEMMLTLRSSFHERRAHDNISFRLLRASPDHYGPSAVVEENNAMMVHDNVSSPLCEEKHSELHQKDATDHEVDITGLDVTFAENNVTGIEVDVTGVDVDSLDDNATTEADQNKLIGTGPDVIDSKVNLLVSDGAFLEEGENRGTSVESSVPDKEVDDISVNNVSMVKDKSFFGIDQIETCEKMDADVIKTESCVEGHVSLDNDCDISALKHKVKDIKAALTLSGILDQDIVQQIQIKRAEVLLPKRGSVIDVQRTGHVAQSIKQFSQPINSERDQGTIKPLISKRGTSPIRIPTIFTKSKELKSPLKESKTNIQSVLADGSVLENVILQDSVKTPHRLLPPHVLKPLPTPSSARNHRPQIKRLRGTAFSSQNQPF
ncbi:hypothetical protein Btru_059420 [Bulinus truncatus]|nr:hypothetical protein Btru_059420 [Bulinus truncatus]